MPITEYLSTDELAIIFEALTDAKFNSTIEGAKKYNEVRKKIFQLFEQADKEEMKKEGNK